MSDVMIRAERLGKSYEIRHEADAGHTRFTEMLTDRAQRLFRRGPDPTRETFWALRDVSFEIRRGEVVGIIGRNGAGKSTLLKVLSRITEPTEGRVEIRGRVASLLEVGTGFHPELTGRENIYLNGAILGMSRAEIRRKFDEIVNFSGVEKFLDTPVKRYSSGMYVRLAFAVAAHLEPEILVVDEVLAVGDAEFQKKSLAKMEAVADAGRTVLFVSHNLASIRMLCEEGLLLAFGRKQFFGSVDEAVRKYFASSAFAGSLTDVARAYTPRVKITRAVLGTDPSGKGEETPQSGQPLYLRLEYVLDDPALAQRNLEIGLRFRDAFGQRLFAINTSLLNRSIKIEGDGSVLFHIPRLPLAPGSFYLSIFTKADNETDEHLEDVIGFTVERRDFFGTGRLPESYKLPILVDFDFE